MKPVFIELTDTRGNSVYVNANSITYMRAAPNEQKTSVFFGNEHWVAVKQSPEQIINSIRAAIK